MSNQGFLTFASPNDANKFLNKYTTTALKIQGRKVKIAAARTNSLLGLSMEMQNKDNDNTRNMALKKVLRTRKLKTKLRNDDTYAKKCKLKRQIRRLRHRLRLKAIDDSEFNRIVKEFESHRLQEMESQQEKPKELQDLSKLAKISNTIENPPNKVLLVQNLPSGTTDASLSQILGNEALVEIRLVSVRNLAFIEYKTVSDATKIKNQLGPVYKLKDNDVTIGYAK